MLGVGSGGNSRGPRLNLKPPTPRSRIFKGDQEGAPVVGARGETRRGASGSQGKKAFKEKSSGRSLVTIRTAARGGRALEGTGGKYSDSKCQRLSSDCCTGKGQMEVAEDWPREGLIFSVYDERDNRVLTGSGKDFAEGRMEGVRDMGEPTVSPLCEPKW